MARRSRARGVTLRACVAALVVTGCALLMATGAARADTPWGSTGASYRSGIVCALPDGRRVALASWAVDGSTAFSTADIVARGSSYGAAPVSGAASEFTPGTRGLGAGELAALAYLIGHAGTGTPAQVAETSALVAQLFGGGSAQQRCLGRQGTSAAAAAELLATAARVAGPYTVQVSAVGGRPGSVAPVTATVLSAAGVPAPGIGVSFAADGAAVGAVTGTNGRAAARITVPQGAGTLTATVTEPTGLRLIASHPASVTLGSAPTVVGRAPVTPVLHPTPALSVTGGSALVLSGGTLSPTVNLTGTYGYAGTGSVAVVGPVSAPAGASCSNASYAGASPVWNGTFSFTGDGALVIGSTGALKPGCYAFTGHVTTTESTPAVTATAAVDATKAVGVSAVQITQSVGSGLARAGALTATVTATSAAGASVSSTLTTYGPQHAAADGQCTGVIWTGAKVLARSAAVPLAAQAGDRLTAAVHTSAVAGTGCYALVARSTVTQDGRSAVVSTAPGTEGTTVLVIAPAIQVANSAYDGRQGEPMAGTVQITGTLGLAGNVAIGLVSAPAPVTGCHGVTFPATPSGGTTTVATSGDGDYQFRSPVPSQNRCYGVVATLAMSADAAIRVAAPPPGDTAVFLAGATPPASTSINEHAAPASRSNRIVTVLGVSGAVVLAIALALMGAAAAIGQRKPDPRAGELLLEISSSG